MGKFKRKTGLERQSQDKSNLKQRKKKFSNGSTSSSKHSADSLQTLRGKIKAANNTDNLKKDTAFPLENTGRSDGSDLDGKIHQNKSGKKRKKCKVEKELLDKFSRGEPVKGSGIQTKMEKKRILKKEKTLKWATEQSARSTILLTEVSGYIEADENEVTRQYTQDQIAKNVDITSAAKKFELNLDFGPYRGAGGCLSLLNSYPLLCGASASLMNYTKNGRHLLLGGSKGHLASFDWVSKSLMCETNVMEQIFDVQWLHQETMFAVAQKDWVYMYDNKGIELHCLKSLHKVIRMEFLPYHFLLATGNEDGFLGWLDVSMGKLVSHFNSKHGRLQVMTQNPYNATICLGHTNGTVTMWSPMVREPLVKMLCHKQPLTSLAVDHCGLHMVSAAVDRSVKVWDVRHLRGPLQDYRMPSIVNNIAVSQRGLVATSSANIVQIYSDFCKTGEDAGARRPYLKQKLYKSVENMQFCPYEDVLGVATQNGFSSLLIPGSGEPNYDAYEANPLQSKSQRREAEVKALLEKIQPEMITLDPTMITEIDVPTLKDKIEAKRALMFVKPPRIDFTPRTKAKRYGTTVRMAKTKKIVREERKREFVKAIQHAQNQQSVDEEAKEPKSAKSVLDRFRPVPKKRKTLTFDSVNL